MLRFRKKTQYALIAVCYLVESGEGERVSVQSLADQLHLPVKLMAKVMQDLKRGGLVNAIPGARGGYALCANPHEVSFADFLEVFEEVVALTDCCCSTTTCTRQSRCLMESRFRTVNERLRDEFAVMTLGDFVSPDESRIDRDGDWLRVVGEARA